MLHLFKKNHFYITGVLLAIAFFSCKKQLIQVPQTELSDGSFWKTSADIKTGCNYLYNFLPGLNGTGQPGYDLYSDIAFATSGNAVSNGSRSVPSTVSEWTDNYKLIRAANNIIEKSAGVTGIAADINRYVGEARFFRAWGYFELVKRWGNVQVALNTIADANDSTLYSKPRPRQEVINIIYDDLDFAAANCPQPDVMAAADYGRITRSAALGFKSRVALFEGTWDKFRNIATATSNLQKAADAAQTVITEGKQALYTAQGADSYSYEFQYDGGATGNPITINVGPQVNYTYATNKENLMARLYGVNISNSIASHTFERTTLEQGGFVGTKNLVDMYLYSDGLPVGKSAWDSSINQTSTFTDYRNRDPRLPASYWITGEIFPSNGGLINFSPGLIYKIKKMFVVSAWQQQTAFYNFNIMRYAEILLNYAEAKFELSGSISDADLNLTVNALRNRATGNNVSKLPLLTNAFATAKGLDMRTELRRERTVELAFEGYRYWDLLRWKTAETILPQAILGRKFIKAENGSGTSPTNLDANNFLILEASANRKFDANKDYLWPYPTTEIGLTKNAIVQNPGW